MQEGSREILLCFFLASIQNLALFPAMLRRGTATLTETSINDQVPQTQSHQRVH